MKTIRTILDFIWIWTRMAREAWEDAKWINDPESMEIAQELDATIIQYLNPTTKEKSQETVG